MNEKLVVLLAETHAVFRDGYTSEQVDAVLGELGAAVGLRLVTVWEYVDAFGTAGNSLFAVDRDGRLEAASTALWCHLAGESDPATLPALVAARGPEALVETPGQAGDVLDIVADATVDSLTPVGCCNYAGENRI